MPCLAEFRYLKPQQRGAKTILYGAREKDGPWFRLTKREMGWVADNLHRGIIPATNRDGTVTVPERNDVGDIVLSRFDPSTGAYVGRGDTHVAHLDTILPTKESRNAED